jgi:diaminopimelate decarboxylase
MRKQGHLYRYSKEDYSRIIQDLLKDNPELETEKALYIYSKELLQNRLEHLEEVYPKDVLHAVAIKTNSLADVLEYIVEAGHGLEAASYEEVELAIKAGCSPNKIIFDSPAKTREEIAKCDIHFPGLYVNANSLQELDRLKETSHLRIGVRVNPLVDVKSPGIFNVSHKNSKFGIPISLEKEILEKIFSIPNIEGLHVHAGSEIGNINGHVEAIGVVYDLAEKINQTQKDTIQFLDIGGGFPAKTKEGTQNGLEQFVENLKKRCLNLFSNYQVITEYGRFVHTHNAFAISRVEYELDYYQPKILIAHLGADLFVREVYSSAAPYHAIHLFDNNGKEKQSDKNECYDIGGPLCFSGDFVGRNIDLPKANEGDWLVVADCGSNTISMWSQHCSREKIRVTYYENKTIEV